MSLLLVALRRKLGSIRGGELFVSALRVSAASGVADGSLSVDTRLREALRAIRRDDGSFALPGEGPRLLFARPSAAEDAAFAAEASLLVEIDGVVRANARVHALERRLDALERWPLRRLARR